jgi:formylglycine-generating enzyme required for sulfatase activity
MLKHIVLLAGAVVLIGFAPAPFPKPDRGELTNSIGMKLVHIQAGRFTRGSPLDEKDREPFDKGVERQHEVEIARDFYLSRYTVTQEEYKNVMGTNPSAFSPTGDLKGKVIGLDTRNFPVEMVSWEDAMKFCEKLTQLPKEKVSHRVYRLPFEAEWEYACRAGTRTKYHSGHRDEDLEKAGWCLSNSGGRAHKVGKKRPNRWGLYDMHGNVFQWCADWYHPPEVAVQRVQRGGSWGVEPRYCRAAARDRWFPYRRSPDVGFRVVCVVSSTP